MRKQLNERYLIQSEKSFLHPIFRIYSLLFIQYRIRSFNIPNAEPHTLQGRMICTNVK
jgi:hypothetical protein